MCEICERQYDSAYCCFAGSFGIVPVRFCSMSQFLKGTNISPIFFVLFIQAHLYIVIRVNYRELSVVANYACFNLVLYLFLHYYSTHVLFIITMICYRIIHYYRKLSGLCQNCMLLHVGDVNLHLECLAMGV
jgi:hypothetical protein